MYNSLWLFTFKKLYLHSLHLIFKTSEVNCWPSLLACVFLVCTKLLIYVKTLSVVLYVSC